MVTRYDVLIIDDSMDDYELYHRMLLKSDNERTKKIIFQLRHARDGSQGLDEIDRHPPIVYC